MQFAGTGGEGGEYRRHFSPPAAETDGKPARDSCGHRSAASGASQSLSWPPRPEGGSQLPAPQGRCRWDGMRAQESPGCSPRGLPLAGGRLAATAKHRAAAN